MRAKEGDKKRAIFKATLKLITSRGFHATPMSLIAEEAGVAAGTIYLYFKNKEDLLNQLYLNLKQAYSTALMEGYSPELPVRIAFERIWHNSLNYQLHDPLEFSFMEQFKNSPLIEKVTLEEGLKFFQAAGELIERARR
ncbi:MAG TPA: helix-turn-helix domain-containing protein, partial [Anaerolineae bacterium]|nr:helix-turn-helix domain-containing protein [Anaerolineae bacterium]